MSLLPGGTVLLNNGNEFPKFGQGLSHNSGGFVKASAEIALQKGVRLFDTAKRYGSESQLGYFLESKKTMFESTTVPLVCTKFWPGDIGKTSSITEDIERAARESAKDLRVDKLDLYLLHWPGSFGASGPSEREKLWKGMESLIEKNIVKNIGLSNFEPEHIKDVLRICKIKPCVNQIEFNPFQTQEEIRNILKKEKIQLMGYCPLAKGKGLSDPVVNKISRKLRVSAAAILISWSLQKGAITIPASRSPQHIADNIEATNVVLDSEDIEALDSLHCDLRVTWDPRQVE